VRLADIARVVAQLSGVSVHYAGIQLRAQAVISMPPSLEPDLDKQLVHYAALLHTGSGTDASSRKVACGSLTGDIARVVAQLTGVSFNHAAVQLHHKAAGRSVGRSRS
jgi:hypothetical protein